MDDSRRKFIIGMATSCVALSIPLVPVLNSGLKKENTQNVVDGFDNNSYYGSNFFSSDFFSSAVVGTAMTGAILYNLDLIYSIMIVLISLFIFFMLGVPGYEVLIQQPFVNL